MSRIRPRSVAAVAVLLIVAASAALAQSRAPFEGSYSLSDVTESAAYVSVELSITITNNSGGEVHDGILRILRNSRPDAEPYAEFDGISMPLGGSVRLTEGLVLTASEYAALDGLEAEIEAFDENSVTQNSIVDLEYRPSD